jgi:biopolymer transport protein ExbB/TolQ/gas vesicle protein
MGIHYGLVPILDKTLDLPDTARAIRGFFFERTAIQWCTMWVFFFSVTVLAARCSRHWALAKALNDLEQGSALPTDLSRLHGLVRRRLEALRSCIEQHGREAAYVEAERLAERDEESVHQVFSLLGSAVQVMLALGFFGTVWGISRSMFGSFSDLASEAAASPDEIKVGLKHFTRALGTALDTTVLALVCGVLTSIVMTVLQWAEVGGLHRLAEQARRWFHLKPPAGGEPSGPHGQASTLAAELSSQFETFAQKALETFRARLDDAAGEGLRHVREGCQSAKKEMIAQLQQVAANTVPEVQRQVQSEWQELHSAQQQFQDAVQSARASFESQMEAALTETRSQAEALRVEVGQKLLQIEKGLSRVPSIEISYPQAGSGGKVEVSESGSADQRAGGT